MEFKIKEIRNDDLEIKNVKNFLYGQIKKEYGIGPNMKFHYDIESMDQYYINPSCKSFFVVYCEDRIVATAGIRAYDKDFEFFRGVYSKEDTASIWRLMVDEEFRRNGLARRLVNVMEDFARDAGYERIYLHTHRYLDAALPFWKSLGYEITVEEDDYDQTTHMIKYLC
jgi:GNAT superfamily N-acetyltransferase